MSHPHIPSLLKTLQIPSQVHTVYLIGSRLWGTHSPTSDFDLLVVIADPVSSTSAARWQKSQHKDQCDVTLLSESEFRQQVKEGSIIEALCCLIPDSEECVLMNDGAPRRRELISKDQLGSLRAWVDERQRKDREKAMKFWAKGGADMRQRALKILRHSISAECILLGLKIMVEEENIGLKDVILTQENLRRMVAMGIPKEGDTEWLDLDSWDALEAVYRERMQTVKEGRLE
ncbi:hypothetical protein C8J57DRAFT_662263 [Mycena rebaudengoi]|nr:hypothetical protein C8J57DRAFT_662263 [Mycena rebaudengoi]